MVRGTVKHSGRTYLEPGDELECLAAHWPNFSVCPTDIPPPSPTSVVGSTKILMSLCNMYKMDFILTVLEDVCWPIFYPCTSKHYHCYSITGIFRDCPIFEEVCYEKSVNITIALEMQNRICYLSEIKSQNNSNLYILHVKCLTNISIMTSLQYFFKIFIYPYPKHTINTKISNYMIIRIWLTDW